MINTKICCSLIPSSWSTLHCNSDLVLEPPELVELVCVDCVDVDDDNEWDIATNRKSMKKVPRRQLVPGKRVREDIGVVAVSDTSEADQVSSISQRVLYNADSLHEELR